MKNRFSDYRKDEFVQSAREVSKDSLVRFEKLQRIPLWKTANKKYCQISSAMLFTVRPRVAVG